MIRQFSKYGLKCFSWSIRNGTGCLRCLPSRNYILTINGLIYGVLGSAVFFDGPHRVYSYEEKMGNVEWILFEHIAVSSYVCSVVN